MPEKSISNKSDDKEFFDFLQNMTALVLEKFPDRTEPVRVILSHHYSFEGWLHSQTDTRASLQQLLMFASLCSSGSFIGSTGMRYTFGIASNTFSKETSAEFTTLICEVSASEAVVTRWSIYLGEIDHLSPTNVVDILQDDVWALITEIVEKIEGEIKEKIAGSHDQSV